MSHLVPLSMPEAIYSLCQCQLTLDATESLDYLETQLNIYSLLALYQHYFPTEWKASQASIYPPTDVDCHSPRELEFIVLIYTHLFPLSHWTVETAYEQRLHSIPITTMGIDWTMDGEIEHLKDGWQLLLPFSHDGHRWLDDIDPEGSEWFDSEFAIYGITYSDIDHPDKIDQKELKRQCHQSNTPLKFLPIALRLLDHETKNVWLDEYANDYYYQPYSTSLPWSKASIDLLTRKWQQADRMLNCATNLIDWLEADLKPHAQILLKLWKQALKPR
ncbi:hypothetical protein [Nostoc sp. 2RC]|uniref:hypothetical protein n=1 Tax=Nostoc sp. 2RC TaxID=2485484 RepID=UPI0016278490|nr:hypothetical protein [Nostoc sp. 2RC]MBC1236157.1 hypothetical protein [Nostoc sp. 2RC]